MRFTHLFINRPILATVVSVFITLIGLGAMFVLPVAQYPEIVPPTVQVTTVYPGASAEVVAQTVATPLMNTSERVRRTTLHLTQIFFTDDRTFMLGPS